MSSENSDEEPKYSAYDHLKQEVKQKSKSSPSSSGTPAIIKVFFIGIILFGALMYSGVLTNDPFGGGTDDGTNSPIGGSGDSNTAYDLASQCINDHDNSGLAAHYHFQLNIYIDNVAQVVPANVGIEGGCMRPMHTHSSDGKIHIELPADYDGGNPPLGLFFDIWGKSLSSNSLLDQSGEVTMYLNGGEFTSAPGSYPPVNDDTIDLYLVTS